MAKNVEKTDYKATLNLPKTDFPMQAKLTEREPQQLARWEAMDLYTKLRMLRKNAESFIVHDGPPFANGEPHLGHAVNRILKDCIVKSKSLSGYDVPFVPGWDCHGLPIEVKVEKAIGRPDGKISRSEFRKACRAYAASQIAIQKAVFKRLGTLADWEHPYLTMDYAYEANIIRGLAQIVAQGHLVRGLKPVHWCLNCQSTLADFELEYRNKPSSAIDVTFPVADLEAWLERFTPDQRAAMPASVSIPIWTTTPWTLPANQAVAVHPDEQYVCTVCHLPQRVEGLVIAEKLLETVLKRYDASEHHVVASFEGKALEGLQLSHPFANRSVPVVLADYVTLDTGTGAVHTAPGHGLEDYATGQHYGLRIDNPVDGQGVFVEGTPWVAGKTVWEANGIIVSRLREGGQLLHVETIQHSYPHCWRHKTPTIFRATPQWFISMEEAHLRDTALSALEETDWFPAWGRESLASMIKQRSDWCISRQRIWFVPLPLFTHQQTGELHPRTVEILEAVADRIEQGGIEVWDALDPRELIGEEEAHDYEKSQDALDVWMDSGLSHACVLEQREELRFPADVYIEGSDQYRGWFQSSLLTASALQGRAPYRHVIMHGFTVDEKGHKMSKSLGNVILPAEVMDKLGADVLRLFVASSDYHNEIAFSQAILEHTADIYRRIRNTARFLLANLWDFDPLLDPIAPDKLLALDRWAVHSAARHQNDIRAAYDRYDFNTVTQQIHQFCSETLSSFYLDIIKDRQYTSAKTGLPRRSAQTAIYHVLQALVRWIAPILSFTADAVWSFIPGERAESVFLTKWYEGLFELRSTETLSEDAWERIIHVRNAVNKSIETLRAEKRLGAALEAEVVIYAAEPFETPLRQFGDELRFVLITSDAAVRPLSEAPQDLPLSKLAPVKVAVTKSARPKCVRCWHHRADVGAETAHPTLCSRCVKNVSGPGEMRRFA